VAFPTDHPLASVQPQAIPGWDIKVTTSKLDKPLTLDGRTINEAVSKVTWTATGKGIEPGYFQKFPLSLGQLPEDTDQLVFKALQTYSNKEVVRWIEPQAEGQDEPEHPAPTLQLSAAAEGDHHDDAAASPASAPKDTGNDETSTTTAAQAGGSSDGTARGLGIAGIVVGAAGVLFGILAARRSRA
jgi:uncharacterized protein